MVLSIITINYNNSEGLARTLESIHRQTFKDFELIVIDGASEDESLEVIQAYKADINYWVSEKDKGIYHAQNKGIAKATGTYCLFLNSGDLLCEDAVLDKVFKSELHASVIYGNMKIVYKNGQTEWGEMPESLTLYHMYIDTLWHPVSFIKRTLFTTFGFYREDLKIAADYDFFFRCCSGF